MRARPSSVLCESFGGSEPLFAPLRGQAAEQLGRPFSTYRRYLKRGIEHVAEALREQELAA